MSGAPDLVVHVGLDAAATLLTSALPLLEDGLGRLGVRVAAAGAPPSVGGAPLLVAAPAAGPPSDPDDVLPFCSLTPEDVAGVIERSGARRVRVLLSPERQDRLLERAYRAAVADGFTGTLVERFPRWAEPLVDYVPLAAQLRSLPGVTDLRVLPLELVAAGQTAYVGALLAALDCPRPIDLRPLATWDVPREFATRSVGMARAMAPYLDTDDERAKVREYLLSTYAVPVGDAPKILTGPQRTDVIGAYRLANEAFFSGYVPDLAPSSYGGRAGLEALAAVLTPVHLRPRVPVQDRARQVARTGARRVLRRSHRSG